MPHGHSFPPDSVADSEYKLGCPRFTV